MSTFIDGLSLGSIYALIALGYTMVYGIAKMLNFAHGDIIMVGAYAILTTLNICGNPIVAIVVSVVVCTLLGIVTEKLAYKPLRGASPLAVLITAIGVSYLLQSIAQLIYGAKFRSVTIATFKAISIGGAKINIATIISLVAGAIIMAALTVFNARYQSFYGGGYRRYRFGFGRNARRCFAWRNRKNCAQCSCSCTVHHGA